jgi:nitroreductase/NAD-dependent dihydropyrimidine dehydrogenase PreA subunit
MSQIIIDQSRCTKCNVCSKVCIVEIIQKSNKNRFPTVDESRKEDCIKCGHCEAFCAQKALTLDFLTEEKIDAPLEGLVTQANLSLYIKKRRSIRHFTKKTVSKELLSELIDVARYAASGGNQQPVKWHVIYDSAKVQQIARLTIDWMRSIQNTPHPLANYVSSSITAWDNGSDKICHNAPHLIFAHTPDLGPYYNPTDAVIALTHIDIPAPAFGLGTCWAGFVMLALNAYKPLQEVVALPVGRKAACPLMIGYSSHKITSIPRRNPVDISWI